MEHASADLYMSGWPGRWRVLPDRVEAFWSARFSAAEHATCAALRAELKDDLPAGLDFESVDLAAVCAECGCLVIRSAARGVYWNGAPNEPRRVWQGPFTTTEALHKSLGDHRHDENVPAGKVRYYLDHPTGPWKTEVIGTWTDLILAIPYLVADGWPVPPLSVVNEVLGAGGANAGMSGGVECPPHQLQPSEYHAIRDTLIGEKGCIPVEAPEGLTRWQYIAWKSRHRWHRSSMDPADADARFVSSSAAWLMTTVSFEASVDDALASAQQEAMASNQTGQARTILDVRRADTRARSVVAIDRADRGFVASPIPATELIDLFATERPERSVVEDAKDALQRLAITAGDGRWVQIFENNLPVGYVFFGWSPRPR